MAGIAEQRARTRRASRRGTRLTVAAWALLAVVVAVALAGTLTDDFRDRLLSADQASFVLQAISLGEEGDLTYEASDIERWRDVGWAEHPFGLHLQRHDGGWAFAKPYGVSALTAPFVAVLGVVRATAVVSSLLLVAHVAVAAALLGTWLRGPAVPLGAGALTFASNAWFFAYPVGTDLFLAVLVGAAVLAIVRGLRASSATLVAVGVGLAAFAVSEKATLVLVLAPLIALALVRLGDRTRRAVVVAVGVAVWALAVWPYWHHSDGASLTAYGGDRYVLTGSAPFEPGSASEPQPAGTDEPFSPGYVLERAVEDPADDLAALVTYVAGRHTGLLAFSPFALGVLVAALARARRLDPLAWTLLGGVLAYVALYVVVFTDNYFGGGQSIGNRYFLQVSLVTAAIAGAAGLSARLVSALAVGSVVVALVLIPHHLTSPDVALVRLHEVGPVQSWLPVEPSDISGAELFRID
jgi:hypothetical protein